MRKVGIASLARFLAVAPRAIRSWEEEVPLLSPGRGVGGRKEYGVRELACFDRLAWLRRERALGPARARDELIRARTDPATAAARADLDEARAALLKRWIALEELRLRAERALTLAARLAAAMRAEAPAMLAGTAPPAAPPPEQEEPADRQLELPW